MDVSHVVNVFIVILTILLDTVTLCGGKSIYRYFGCSPKTGECIEVPNKSLIKSAFLFTKNHPANHRLQCTPYEKFKTACLNGGLCFATQVEHRTVQCACSRSYVGRQCEMINPIIIFNPGRW